MSNAQLLVVGGYATSGKDAFADILVKELGWYKTYMSKPLETALLTLNPWIPLGSASKQNCYWQTYKEVHNTVGYDESKKYPEVRRLLQTLGTEVGRNQFNEDIWVDLACREIVEKLKLNHRVVVTGIRYQNEIDKMRQLGAKTVWVERPGVLPINAHSSDNTLAKDSFDILCVNKGNLEELKNWAFNYFKEF